MQVRLLTYNIHKAIGVDRQFRPERIIAVLEHHDPDIVLLQEVDRDAPRSNHLDLAEVLATELRYDYRAVGMNVFLSKGRYGNVTLSRHPIGRQRNIDLTVGWRKRRGAQHTNIQIASAEGTVELEVFNVHLGLLARERREQIGMLLNCPDVAQLDPDKPCIIAGDMNDWQGMLKRQRFARAGFQCATNRSLGSRWSIKTFPSYAPTSGLDKIFYRGNIRLLRVQRSRLDIARVASDHLPVIAEFEL